MKTKVPIFCLNNTDINCYGKNKEFKVIINDNEINDDTNITQLEKDINIINLKWNEINSGLNFMFSDCEKYF